VGLEAGMRRARGWRWLWAFVMAVAIAPVQAATSLWRIDGGQGELYLGGTLHLLRASDFPLPPAFAQAYERADRLIFETDVAALSTPAAQRRLRDRGTYDSGRALREALRPEPWSSLKAWGQRRGVSPARLERMRPQLAAVTVTLVELANLGAHRRGVDVHFFRRALAEGKPRGHLESLEEQLEYLLTMGREDEDALIRQTLDEVDELGERVERQVAAWRSGDPSGRDAAVLAPMRRKYPDVYESLIVERNEDWMPELKRLLRTAETELVLVGVAHVVGPHGLLARLRKAGYRVATYPTR